MFLLDYGFFDKSVVCSTSNFLILLLKQLIRFLISIKLCINANVYCDYDWPLCNRLSSADQASFIAINQKSASK